MPAPAAVLATLALAVPAALVAGCGDDETTSGSAAATTPAAATSAATAADDMKADAKDEMQATKADVPDFSGTLADGGTFDQSMVTANTVIHVLASWCPTCKAEAPEFAKFQREHPDLTYLYVAVEDDPKDTKAFLAEHGMADGKIINDTDREVAGAFGLTGQPNTVFVPAEGDLIKILGPSTADGLAAAAAKL